MSNYVQTGVLKLSDGSIHMVATHVKTGDIVIIDPNFDALIYCEDFEGKEYFTEAVAEEDLVELLDATDFMGVNMFKDCVAFFNISNNGEVAVMLCPEDGSYTMETDGYLNSNYTFDFEE